MVWETIERPGYSGKKRDEKYAGWDGKYGRDNWRIAWLWNGGAVEREFSYHLYETSYGFDSFKREDLWKELLKEACDVYDMSQKDTESGLDYFIQQDIATHLQDIAIRRVVATRGWRFEGSKLVQIRSHDERWGKLLSPGKVHFHLPELIVSPHLKGWWDCDSVEDFYQSNKVLQLRKQGI